MSAKKSQNNSLQVEITAEDIKNFKQDLRSLHSSVELEVDNRLRKSLQLIKTKDKTEQQQQELNNLLQVIIYPFLLDNGTLLSGIPSKAEKQYGLLAIRERLIAEYNCNTAAEIILVDQIAAGYWRLMKYEVYACRLPEKDDGWSFDQLKVNVLKEARQQIEQAHRQISIGITMLKDLKQPQLKVNVKAESAYFAQNQQVINEKPQTEPQEKPLSPNDLGGL